MLVIASLRLARSPQFNGAKTEEEHLEERREEQRVAEARVRERQVCKMWSSTLWSHGVSHVWCVAWGHVKVCGFRGGGKESTCTS